MTYTFPFDTCEIPYRHSKHIAQPFSALINVISVGILVIAIVLAKTSSIQVFFGALLVFELIHTYSHIRHLPGHIQMNVIHAVAYIVNLSYLAIFIGLTGTVSPYLLVSYAAILLLDVYFFARNQFLGYFTTQIVLGLLVTVFYMNYILRFVPIYWLIALLGLNVVLIALFINEKNNCASMLASRPFPYHILVEWIGLVVIVVYIRILLFLNAR